jgi:hypothetical protein
MTLDTKKGILNVVEATIALLRAELPAAVTTANAATSANWITPLAASWTLDADKTLILSRNSGTSVTGTISSGTYTAAQLVTAINGDANLSAVWTADAVMNSTRVRVYDSTRGTASNIKIGAGTINSILGLTENTVYTYVPLNNIQQFTARQEDLEHQLAAYPALVVRADQVFPDFDTTGEMIDYDLRMRLYDVYQTSSGGSVDVLYHNLVHMAELIIDVITSNATMDGQTNGTTPNAVRPSDVIQIETGVYRGWVDFELTISVQENLY